MRLALALLSAPLLALATFHAAVAFWPYPQDLARPAPISTIVHDRTGVPLAAFAASDGQWRLPLREDEISPHLFAAIVAVEDARFYEHHGVDWSAACAAVWQNTSALRVRRGASTLTMQLHRLRDPKPRSLAAKLEQAVRAAQIDRQLTKREILTEYLNRAPFGGNLVGVGAASWRYFDKPCASLSLGEAALLAGLPKNPNHYRPDQFPQCAAARRQIVLDRMLALGMISVEQHARALAEPIRAQWKPLPQQPDDAAFPALAGLASASRDDHGQITTTIDAIVQRQAAATARAHLARLAHSGVSAAAVVVLDTSSAECLAAVNIAPDRAADVDLTRRPRSTGSVLKPLIYAAAFEAGVCAPESIVDDSPAAWAGYVPRDYDRQFRGQMTASDALADSRNIPAMTLLARTGVAHVRGVMESSGLETLARADRTYGLSLAIGGAEATPLEVATAYAGLARGGTTKRVTFSLSPILLKSQISDFRSQIGRETRFLSSCACMQTLAALAKPDRTTDLSRAAARLNVAWKTGTSSGHRDAWCAAVTPRRTVVVWLGNAGGDASPALVGRDAAAPLALELIAALDETPAKWESTSIGESAIAVRLPAPPPRPPLVIVSPAPDRTIQISDDVPVERQRVPLQSAGAGAGNVHWFVDGNHVAASRSTAWWTPAAGVHEVRVVDADGRAADCRVRVEPAATITARAGN